MKLIFAGKVESRSIRIPNTVLVDRKNAQSTTPRTAQTMCKASSTVGSMVTPLGERVKRCKSDPEKRSVKRYRTRTSGELRHSNDDDNLSVDCQHYF